MKKIITSGIILQKLNEKRMEIRYWLRVHPDYLYFFYFIFHNLKPYHFNCRYAEHNCHLIMKLGKGQWIDATYKGELKSVFGLIPKGWLILYAILSLGATRARVQRAIYTTFLIYSLEVNNPFSKALLLHFLKHKERFLKNLLNRSPVDKRTNKAMELELDAYLRSSYLQLRIIEKMHKATRGQKKKEIIERAKEGIASGLPPLITTTGQSGTYFIRGKNRELLGVFKPFDEEIGAPNNPLGHLLQGALGQRRIRKTARTGESAHHEVASYLVDDFFGFGLIPPTYYACFESDVFFCNHEKRDKQLSRKVKLGSFQEYIEGFITVPMANDQQLHAIKLLEYQMLMVLDMIIGNLDRNSGNIFIGNGELAAIDHGLTFPDNLKEPLSTWWWAAPFLREFPINSSLLALLKRFPFDELAWKLRKRCFIELGAIDRMRERLALFSEGLDAGLVPFRLIELMNERHLAPLLDLQTTLPFRAKEVVRNYIAEL